MAGVGDSVVVSRSTIDEELLALGKDERSLQELIDSELALRISRSVEDQTMSSLDDHEALAKSTLNFLEAETLHSRLCLDDKSNININNSLPDTTEDGGDWTTVEEVVHRMNNPVAINQTNEINHNDVKFPDNINSIETTNSVCVNNNNTNLSISESFTTRSSEIIVETKTTTTTKTITLDNHIVNSNEQQIVNNNHVETIEDNYNMDTTIDNQDIVNYNNIQVLDNQQSGNHLDQVDRLIENEDQVIHTHQSNHFIISEEIKETTEKKTKKKKTSVENGEAVITKVKKKKSKKSDEKENHISVTQSYVNEASKTFNSPVKHTEEPVPPSVPIRELRRSFGDIHTACENADLNYELDEKQLRARSLGDLRKIEKQPVVTGVNVKQLASFWRTVSVSNISRSVGLSPSRLEKSSFSKFDQLSKKTVLHVRSSDPAKAQKTFSQGGETDNPTCKACGKTVFVMEQIKAERAVWHKNCFRCNTCNKQLTIDIYSSHEGTLYCKPHFKELFTPKAVVETEEPASDKPDLGLEELSSLNVKSKFQVFEKGESNQDEESGPTKVEVKRSPSILSKMVKFQKRGMDVGVTDQDLDGFVYEESSSEEEEEQDEGEEEEGGVIKCRKVKEKPMSFGKMDDVKKNWESGATRKEEMLEQKRQDLQHLRSRLFMGKQVKMKEMYEQAVAESEGKVSIKESDVVRSDKAKAFREKFEKGEITHSDDEENQDKSKNVDDLSVFEEGISKKSRSIFLEMDAKVQSTPSPVKTTPTPDLTKKVPAREMFMSKRQISEDIVRSSDKVEEITVETADISSKFKFFEKYKAPEKEKRAFRITPPREGQVKTDSPEREVYRDPDVVRSEDRVEEDEVVKRSQTASKMLSFFKQMEEQKPTLPDGPKPKKEFTPPPDFRGASSSEEETEEESEEESEEEEDDGVIKSSYKNDDEFLKGKMAARAKDIAAKFESWEPEKQSANNAVVMLDSEQPSLESTKSLRAHFESLKNQKKEEKSEAKPRVNRFVEPPSTTCSSCEKIVYPLEKIETDGRIFHKQCFRCSHCNCILRMDSYTLNCGNLYCLPHFKQLFISKGNYDEGFGVDQHKRKWEINGTPA